MLPADTCSCVVGIDPRCPLHGNDSNAVVEELSGPCNDAPCVRCGAPWGEHGIGSYDARCPDRNGQRWERTHFAPAVDPDYLRIEAEVAALRARVNRGTDLLEKKERIILDKADEVAALQQQVNDYEEERQALLAENESLRKRDSELWADAQRKIDTLKERLRVCKASLDEATRQAMNAEAELVEVREGSFERIQQLAAELAEVKAERDDLYRVAADLIGAKALSLAIDKWREEDRRRAELDAYRAAQREGTDA